MRAAFISLVIIMAYWVMLPIGARIYDVVYPWEVAVEPAVLENQHGERVLKVGDELRWRGLYRVTRDGCSGVWRRTLQIIDPMTGSITPIFFPMHSGSFELARGEYPLYGLVVPAIPPDWAGKLLRYAVTAEVDCWPYLIATTQHMDYQLGEARVAP